MAYELGQKTLSTYTPKKVDGRGRPPKKKIKNGAGNKNEMRPGDLYTTLGWYRCSCCGNEYSDLENNFMKTDSPLYKGTEGYFPICKKCMEIYYREQLLPTVDNDERVAMERFCSICDWNWNEDALDLAIRMVENGQAKGENRFLPFTYCSRRNMVQHKKRGLTYLDNIRDRWAETRVVTSYSDDRAIDSSNPNTVVGFKPLEVEKEDVWFFGPGYSPDEYHYLREQYNDWCERYDCQSKAQEELFKSLCIAQLNVQRSQLDGDSKRTTESMKTLQDLMDAAKIKPKQKDDAALVEQNTFGTLIEKWEKEKPIPEPAPEWMDVDNIRKYIGVFLFGHLAKMFKLDNQWSQMYDEEIGKYTVTPPKYDGDDDVEDGFDVMYQKMRKADEKNQGLSETSTDGSEGDQDGHN